MCLRRLLISAILAALPALPTWAQVTPVRSGEHATFSRLVFPAPAGITWQLEQDQERDVRLRFEATDLRFDLGGVFALIPRDRLADIRAQGATLDLRLACACAVDVQQIASGHVVIDIRDPIGSTGLPVSEGDQEPNVEPFEVTDVPSLPLQLPPVGTLASGLRVAAASSASTRSSPEVPIDVVPTIAPRPQVTIREHRRAGLLPAEQAEPGSATALPACSLEAIASNLLMRPPASGLDTIALARAATLDDADNMSTTGLRDLADAYLTLGWGAEAAQALRLAGEADGDLVNMAIALDGNPDITNPRIDADPACGPSTTTLLLIAGQFEGNWGSVDEEAFVRFIDRLPDERRKDLETRLTDGLSRLGQADLMTRLIPLPEPDVPYTPQTTEIASAGTGAEAVRAAIDLFAAQQESGQATPPIQLQNALAMRPSIPGGPLRDEFDDLLSRRLLLSGHVAEAISVVQERPDLADALLTVALDELPEEDLVEVAIRLRPFIASDAPQISRVSEIMRSFGLDIAARDFAAIRTGEGLPRHPTLWRRPAQSDATDGYERLSVVDRAWLARDFTRMSRSDGDGPAPLRQEAAELVAQRNAALAPQDDYERAEAALQSSRRVSDIMKRLIDDPE